MEDSTLPQGAPIVVGVDGSPESVLALRAAGRLAGALGCPVKAVAAWHLEPVYGPYAVSDWNGESVMRQELQRALADAFGAEPPAGLASKCCRGRAAAVLLEESREAQMLVVGSRGHGGFAGLLLGSVSSACAAHAACPVLVVHAPKPRGPQTNAAEPGSTRRAPDEPAGRS